MILVPTNRMFNGTPVKVRHPITGKFIDEVVTEKETSETNKYFSRLINDGDLIVKSQITPKKSIAKGAE